MCTGVPGGLGYWCMIRPTSKDTQTLYNKALHYYETAHFTISTLLSKELQQYKVSPHPRLLIPKHATPPSSKFSTTHHT